MTLYLRCFFLLVLLPVTALVKAQSLPVGTTSNLDDYYRRTQLLGLQDSSTSFTVRPIIPGNISNIKKPYYPDVDEAGYNKLNKAVAWRYTSGFEGTLLPLSLQTQVNTNNPYGWNDGAMIPARGLQTLFSAGFFAKYGILTVQFRPEIVIAGNNYFDPLDKEHYDIIAARYYDFYNNIDLPGRFGTKSYTRAYWGQSSIRLNYKAFSFGLSTENLWWGPSINNSLLMSNTAPGFKHLTLNTTKPVKTFMGSFEGQIIAGRLEGSGYPPLLPERELFLDPLAVAKPTDWRYLSGIVLTWQPKWVPGLFLGFTRSAQSYSKDLSGIKSYLPLFSPVKSITADEPIDKRDERSSLFMRWMWLAEHAEFYFEWGKNNNTNDLRNELLDPENSRGYVVGVRKIFPFNSSKGESLLLNVEATQLQETSTQKIADAQSWYVNKYIRHGYTNRGQLLGAGIGPGGNLQTVNISWIKGLKRLGLQFERFIHNNDFYYYAYSDSFDFRRHWVDLSVAASGEWNYKNFIFNVKLQGIRSINYQWYLKQGPDDEYFVDGKTMFNLQMQAGLTYRF